MLPVASPAAFVWSLSSTGAGSSRRRNRLALGTRMFLLYAQQQGKRDLGQNAHRRANVLRSLTRKNDVKADVGPRTSDRASD